MNRFDEILVKIQHILLIALLIILGLNVCFYRDLWVSPLEGKGTTLLKSQNLELSLITQANSLLKKIDHLNIEGPLIMVLTII
jgi:hypothetical protein